MVDTLEFFPTVVPFPTITTKDHLQQAVSDILAILNNPSPTLSFLRLGDNTHKAIQEIATLLHRATKIPNAVLPNNTTPVPPQRVQEPSITTTVPPPRVQEPLVPSPVYQNRHRKYIRKK